MFARSLSGLLLGLMLVSFGTSDVRAANNVLGTETMTDYRQELYRCLEDSYNPRIYELYFDPDGQQRNLDELGHQVAAAEACLNDSLAVVFEPQTITCLESQMGKDRLVRELENPELITIADRNQAAPCFFAPQILEYSTSVQVDNETALCLRLAVDETTLKSYLSGQTRPDLQRHIPIRECLQTTRGLLQTPMILQTPQTVQHCLYQTLSPTIWQEIINGEREPTEQQRNQAQTCFGMINQYQRSFLPLLPDQIVFAEEKPNQIQVDNVRVTALEIPDQVGDPDQPVIQLTGSGPPNTIIDVYVFSQPIVISTATDDSGQWLYQLNYHIPPGDHQAIAVARVDEGYIKSEPFNFTARRVKQTASAISQDISISAVRSGLSSRLNQILIGFLVLMFGLFLLNRVTDEKQKKRRRSASKDGSLPLP